MSLNNRFDEVFRNVLRIFWLEKLRALKKLRKSCARRGYKSKWCVLFLLPKVRHREELDRAAISALRRPNFCRITIQVTVIQTPSKALDLEAWFTAVSANPPYTAHHNLNTLYSESLHSSRTRRASLHNSPIRDLQSFLGIFNWNLHFARNPSDREIMNFRLFKKIK